jgi:hypothetical protein
MFATGGHAPCTALGALSASFSITHSGDCGVGIVVDVTGIKEKPLRCASTDGDVDLDALGGMIGNLVRHHKSRLPMSALPDLFRFAAMVGVQPGEECELISHKQDFWTTRIEGQGSIHPAPQTGLAVHG